MTSSSSNVFCLACADIAVIRGRRVLGVPESERVTLLWKETVKSVIQKEGKQFDADSIIRKKEAYMCKKCYYAYEKFADKKEVLHFTRSKITVLFLNTKCCCNHYFLLN